MHHEITAVKTARVAFPPRNELTRLPGCPRLFGVSYASHGVSVLLMLRVLMLRVLMLRVLMLRVLMLRVLMPGVSLHLKDSAVAEWH